MLVGEHYYFDRRYENELGRGRFGVVFKGHDVRNGNVVAIKEISKTNMTNVERENEIIMLLNHENIVRHYHTDRTDRYIFIVMEFCNYSDLESYYNKHAPLNTSDMNIVLKQLARGLQLLYSNKIIHRDLKPENILLHNNKNVDDPLINDLTLKIADFGQSRFISNNTLATTSPVGTPNYMAPEIYTQEKYDHKADVWSVGLIVYRGLFGRLPEFLNLDKFSTVFNFWNDLNKRNEEPKIEFPFCDSLKLIQLLRTSLIRDVASRINMLNFLNFNLISPEKDDQTRTSSQTTWRQSINSTQKLAYTPYSEPTPNQIAHAISNKDKAEVVYEHQLSVNELRAKFEAGRVKPTSVKRKDFIEPKSRSTTTSTAHTAADQNESKEPDNNRNVIIVKRLDKKALISDRRLLSAARRDNIDLVRALLMLCADPNIKDDDGITALHLAACNKDDNKGLVELLLEYGADIDSQNKDGVTCLMWAAISNNIENVRCLLQNGADMHKKDRNGKNVLHYAANGIHNKFIIELLLKNGADIDGQDKYGETCLMYAAFNNNIEIVRCLLQNGADINRKDNYGCNVLHYAAENKNDNKLIIELLLKNGADIDSQDENGVICLMWAVIKNNIEIARYLLQYGADINKIMLTKTKIQICLFLRGLMG